MEHAVAFARTETCAWPTMHENSANQALRPIINFFTPKTATTANADGLSLNLKSTLWSRACPRRKGAAGYAAADHVNHAA